jgi:hypothetical protein
MISSLSLLPISDSEPNVSQVSGLSNYLKHCFHNLELQGKPADSDTTARIWNNQITFDMLIYLSLINSSLPVNSTAFFLLRPKQSTTVRSRVSSPKTAYARDFKVKQSNITNYRDISRPITSLSKCSYRCRQLPENIQVSVLDDSNESTTM